jgi:anaerobic selenocysteine-containing dehydrogenase
MIDRDYIERYTIGFDELAERVRQYTPEWTARTCGLEVAEVVQLAREYGTTRPAAIRLNYGMQRHAAAGSPRAISPAFRRSPGRGATSPAGSC